MAYKRKHIIQQEPNESNRDYALRVIASQPIGYMNLFRTQLPHILAEFNHLPFETHGERLFNWLYPNSRRTCIECGVPTKFYNLSSGGYRDFCGCSCRAKHFDSNKNGLTPEAVDARRISVKLRTPEQRAASDKQRRTTLLENGVVDNFAAGLETYCDQLMERYGVRNVNQRHYTPDTIRKLNDEHWLREEYHNKKRSAEDVSGDFNQPIGSAIVIRALTKFNIPKHHTAPRSAGEREVEEFVKSLGFYVESSNRSLIKPQELDIVIPEKRLAIEYCGLYWHSTANLRMTPQYHANKMKAVQARGYRLITIFEDEWKNSRRIVEQKLRSILGVSNQPVIYARKCVRWSPPKSEIVQFFADNHIQGPSRHTAAYGLRYNDTLVAVMAFVFSDGVWDLVRYATSCRVVGGFGKLWKMFAEDHPSVKVKTFADLRYSEGGMYDKLGFKLDGMVRPDYYYIVNGNREHKFNYRHSSRLSKMDGYDPLSSESENAEMLGLYKIYNCGLLRYVKHT